MAKQNTLPDPIESAQMMETDKLYKEFEPDANEILFGQKTLPNRLLTPREASKRKKIIMKLVDQKLKFKLIELMRQQVVVSNKSIEEESTAKMTIPTVSQTINYSQPSLSFTGSYQSQPNWFPHSGVAQHVEGNWQQQHCQAQAEWQASIYPQQYGATGGAWNNNWRFQPPTIEPYVHGNNQRSQQKPIKPIKRNVTQNPNLICPMVDVTTKSSSVTSNENTKISTKISMGVEERPNETVSTPQSPVISNVKQPTASMYVLHC